MCARVCVCFRQGRELVFASTALVVVRMAMYLIGYSDYLISL